ncbi:MAG: TldD/PmbA family protein [Spirochaetia bacterium]|jgi:TldD protein|nr:TldD/PmbA family protein [Spirochaetia bacterium]
MPQRSHSAFLEAKKPLLSRILETLAPRFDYVSVLGADDRGIRYSASPGETRTGEPTWVQRGFVFRAQKNGLVAEYACPDIGQDAAAFAARLIPVMEKLLAAPGAIRYPRIPDEPLEAEFKGTVEIDPFTTDPELVLSRLSRLREELTDGETVVMAQSRYECMDISRLFLSPNRSLMQSFAWSQAYLFGVSRRDQNSKTSYRPVSGRKGLELLDDLEAMLPELKEELALLLDSVKIEPGVYEVILDPDMAGTLAHEAFGHGVETDMFFKGRAKAAEYIGKRVGSDLVTMYDGAAGAEQCGSYLFDDEGRTSSKTKVIDRGILASGISDTLSALAMGLPLTGNGRREAYSHKAYARMTNTYFAPGESKFNDMIASVKRGWYLSRLNSGMEDPRNWGIQLIAMVGKEIVNGKFTGRVASPVFCSGYVPDVLGAIDMVSDDFILAGSGFCGKGYKEYVKVSSGGPCIKTKMRLG